MAKASTGPGALWLRRSYSFIDKDPEIDKCRTVWQNDRDGLTEADLAMLAGLASSTVRNMFGGQTRRPQHITYGKIYGALGYEYDLVRKREPDFDKELPKAREQFKAYRSWQAKQKK